MYLRMKKNWIILLVLIIELVFLVGGVFAIRINEIELNPYDNCNDCTEWLELYSNVEINLTGWRLVDASDNSFDLNQTFNGYYVIENPGISLNNANEQIFLYNNTELIDETEIFSDGDNNIKTWQYCSEGWNFTDSTKDSENSCDVDNGGGNENNNENTQEPEIYLEIDWDEEEIINGDEFKIDVDVFNLKDEYYNLKIWIEFKNNDTIISDRYDDYEDEWKSGKYYVDEFFKGPGNESEKIKLRIREDYKHFENRAKIFFKLGGGDESYEYIEILEKEDNSEEEIIVKKLPESGDSYDESMQSSSIDGNVIQLGTPQALEQTEDIKTQKNIVYESKTEIIRKYSIYGFAFLCVGICVLMAFKKLK